MGAEKRANSEAIVAAAKGLAGQKIKAHGVDIEIVGPPVVHDNGSVQVWVRLKRGNKVLDFDDHRFHDMRVGPNPGAELFEHVIDSVRIRMNHLGL